MSKRVALLAAFGITLCFVAVLLSCSGHGEGMRMTRLAYRTILLDADTFRIRFALDDSTLCVRPIHDDGSDWSMVVRQGGDSLYYKMVDGRNILPVENTVDIVCINDSLVYNLKDGKSYVMPYYPFVKDNYLYGTRLSYLGEWNDLLLFFDLWDGDVDCSTIHFTDGKRVPLKYRVYASPTDSDGKLSLSMNCVSIEVTPEELYNYQQIEKEEPDANMEEIKIEYTEETIPAEPSLRVNMEVPKGDTKMAVTIKKHLFQAICDDIFWLLDYNSKQLHSISPIEKGDIRGALEQVSKVWSGEVRQLYHEHFEDSDYMHFSYGINISKVAEGDEYATYFYKSSSFVEGDYHHYMPFSFYITYDKRRSIIVDATNTIKPGMMNAFKEKVPDWVNSQYESFSYRGGLGYNFSCDEMGCCSTTQSGDLHFPLPHLSILPDGVVISFHPFQIANFTPYDFHVFIPKEDIKDCLIHNFWNNDSITRSLSYFVSNVETRN